MVTIAVQPPDQVSVGRPLYPPLVAKTPVAGFAAAKKVDYTSIFAMAVLLDCNGKILTGQLGGTVLVTGTSKFDQVDQVSAGYSSSSPSSSSSSSPSSSSSSPSSSLTEFLNFTFPDLQVSLAGSFSIRMDVYMLDHGNCDAAHLVEQTETRAMTVQEENGAFERPGKKLLKQKYK